MSDKKIKYPRVYISARTHAKVKKLAKEQGKDMKEVGNELVIEGLRYMGY